MATKYYAVHLSNGQSKILTTWSEAQAFIASCPSNAKYRSFPCQEGAQDFLNKVQATVQHTGGIEPCNVPYDKGCFHVPYDTGIAFVDGSYNPKTQYSGWGFILFDPNRPNRTPVERYGQTRVGAETRNVAGEILAAMEAVNAAQQAGFIALVIYHDYQGIASWALSEWKTNLDLTRRYARFMQEAMDSIDISFVKVAGHTGIELNERADTLAKRGCGLV